MKNLSTREATPAPSELVLNPDGSIYHLGLFPEDIAERVFLVGDPGRVEQISSRFDRIELERSNREFLTRTGTYKGRRLSVLSTGIGTDNIDIVVTELDALVNFDLEKREAHRSLRSLELIRIGTSGALQEELPIDSFLFSNMVIGLDGLMHAYAFQEREHEQKARQALESAIDWPDAFAAPYMVGSDPGLFRAFEDFQQGITVTAHGFYGLQGRSLRLPLSRPSFNEELRSFEYGGLQVTNFEMESSALYGLASSLGHRAATICLIIANRYSGSFSADHHGEMGRLIEELLDRSALENSE